MKYDEIAELLAGYSDRGLTFLPALAVEGEDETAVKEFQRDLEQLGGDKERIKITTVVLLMAYAYRQGLQAEDWNGVLAWIIDKPHELAVMVKTAEMIAESPMEIPAEVDEEIKKMNALGNALGQAFGEG